jgi:hypothetical protein
MTNGYPPSPYLVMMRGAQPFRFFPLNKSMITIGRAPNNDIVIMDRSVSRYHARLLFQNGQWLIEDLGSDNGVWINGVRIAAPTILVDDIIFALGQAVRFEMELWPDPPTNVPKRRLFPKWLAPAGLLGLGVSGFVIAGLVLLAILGVLAYFAFGWGGGTPWIQIDYGQAPESAPSEEVSTAELAVDEDRFSAPEVVIIDLEPALHIPLGGGFLLQASAYDEDGVARMDLWVDDQLALSQSNPDPASQAPFYLSQEMLGTSEGTFGIVVEAMDSLGNVGESMAYYITVTEGAALQPPEPVPYIVKDGDTLESIASMSGVSVPDLQNANLGLENLAEPNTIIALPAIPPAADAKPQLPPPDQAPLVGLNPALPWDLSVAGLDVLSANLPGQVMPAFFPDVSSLPNLAQMPKPVFNLPQVSDCKVTLSWQFSSPEAVNLNIYRRAHPQEPALKLLITIPANAVSYVDSVVPGDYVYKIEAVGKKNNNVRERVPSNPIVAYVKGTPNCTQDSHPTKILFFQPTSFGVHDPSMVRANIRYGILRSASRRLPAAQGKSYSLAEWKKRPHEVMHLPTDLLLNPDQPLIFSIDARGLTLDDFADEKPGTDLGTGWTTINQSELNNKGQKEWYLQGSSFGFNFKLWSEEMQWTGKGWTAPGEKSTILAPENLTIEDKSIGWRYLKWDWKGDKNTIDGFIVYRSYSCPGKKTLTRAPLYRDAALSKDIHFYVRNEPAGCAYKYQVSAYGRGGESALSNTLVGLTQDTTFQAARVTFETLEIYGFPGAGRRGGISLRIRGDQRSGSAWLREQTHTLDKMAFDGLTPNNRFGLILNDGDKTRVGYSVYWDDPNNTRDVSFCYGSEELSADDLKNLQGGAQSKKITSSDSRCVGNLLIAALPDYTIPGGSAPPVQSDLEIKVMSRVGYQVFAWVYKFGFDPLEGAKFLLQSKWGESCPGKPDHIYGSSDRWVWGSLDTPPGWYHLAPELDRFYEDAIRNQSTTPNCTRKVWITVSPGKPEDNAGWDDVDIFNNDAVFSFEEITKMKSDR